MRSVSGGWQYVIEEATGSYQLWISTKKEKTDIKIPPEH